MQNHTQIEEDKVEMEDGYITNPFSTKDIKITNQVLALPSLVSKLKYDEIDLNPDFQRNENLWSATQMSRLIESILLKLPLPIFYFDVSNPEKWIVVDGLQRLSTIKRFMVDEKKPLRLKNLEFLTELNGKTYKDLDRGFQRIIEGTQIVTYQIEAQTPKKVRYSIFNRINTGGLRLNAQEIRQALNQQGKGVKFLKECTQNEIFKRVVGVPSNRMLDRELALRFIAFKLSPNSYINFNYNNMGEFLDESMEKLDSIQDSERLEELKKMLLDTLEFSEDIFGQNHRFSRSFVNDNKTKTLNRSIFDVITVLFSEIDNKSLFLERKEIFLDRYKELLKDEKGEFSKAITEGTSGKNAIETRFRIIKKLIEEVMSVDR